MDGDLMGLGEFDRVRHKHTSTGFGEAQHVFIGDPIDLSRVWHDPWVGKEDAVDIGVDLTNVGAEGRCKGDSGCVRSPSPKSGHFSALRIHSLEPGHNHHLAIRKRILDPLPRYLANPGLAV